ncbi:hypothetical protein [Synechococcus sp. MIT S1220]|uniref:hypothetical protein n=1 Tax=Synechococcus sp. MIT S1220 TaxID=3082549 RepID=UPI0039AEBEE6
MRATNLHAFTVSLRQEFPEAESLRIRKAKRASGTVWQLVGVHGNGDTIARQLKASNESEAFHGARELMMQLSGRSSSKSFTKHHLRAALEAITSKGYRDATGRAKVSGVRKVCEWLAERSLAVDEKALHKAVMELAPEENRKRRSVLEAASLLATVAGENLDIEGLRFRNPLPTRRPAVDDPAIFQALDTDLLKLGDPGAISVYRVVVVTGVRANGALSMKIPGPFDGDEFPEGGFQPGVQLPYWDSKRGRAGFCTPTVRDWWDHWDLTLPPNQLKEYWMPHDRPATNEQIEKANNLLSNYAAMLRRKVHKDAAHSLGFRALRHAATARLLKSGMQPLTVAELISTSVAQIEATYSDCFRQHAITEAARLL